MLRRLLVSRNAPVNVQIDAMRLDQLRALGYAVSPEAN